MSRTVTLKATMTRVEWNNPHILFHIDVTSEDGKATPWAVEFTGPNMLHRAGWRRDTVKPGDAVTVVAFPAFQSDREGDQAIFRQRAAAVAGCHMT